MKNINKAEVLTLKNEVNYQSGQVVSKTLTQNEAVSVTLFAFDKDEESARMSPVVMHLSPALTVLEELRLMVQNMNCMKGNPLLCQQSIPMQYMEKSSLKCYWL